MTIPGMLLRILNILLMVGIPAFLALKLYRKGKDGFRPIWIGALAFIISQAGHIPFNQFALMPLLASWGIPPTAQEGGALLALGVAAGISAGLFEELTRYLVFLFWLKKNPSELLPVKYGLGHGGVEAVLLGFVALAALVQVLVLGGDGALAGFGPEQAALIQSQITQYWEVPWQLSLLGAWERISALAFHLGASLMVYKSVVERKPLWLLTAIIGHTLMDAFAVISVQKMDYVLLESILFVFAAGWLACAWFVRSRFEEDAGPPPPAPSEVHTKDSPATPQQLEESRYD
jgi:uncharacterized membrane protein YhfC